MRQPGREIPVLLFLGWLLMLWIVAGVMVLVGLAIARRTRLDRLYERLDLNGRDGKPANGKVLFTFGVFAGWLLVGVWGTVLVVTGEPLGAPFVWLVGVVLCASAGADVLKSVMKGRFGAIGGAVQEHERQRPGVLAAAAEIHRRRELGVDDGTEPV